MTQPEKIGKPLVATSSQTVGPFFHFALTPGDCRGAVAHVSGRERIHLTVRVTDGDQQPVGDAMIEIWQADETVDSGAADSQMSGFARLPSGEDGRCEFETVRPGRIADGTGGRQAAHVNVCLFARGLLRHLHTRIYFAGDPALADDAALALVPADRRQTLMATPDAARPGAWIFELRMQGADETVFFDV
jgi:protocatechuate 3,4-dioxygenase, alpha subunit